MQYPRLFDPYFGIKDASFVVAALIGTTEHFEGELLPVADYGKVEITEEMLEDTEIKSFQFINGRERSICLEVSIWCYRDKAGYIVFGEHKSSDNIFVDTWVMAKAFNVPTVEDFTKSNAYDKRRMFEPSEHHKAADCVRELIMGYIATFATERDVRQAKKALTV